MVINKFTSLKSVEGKGNIESILFLIFVFESIVCGILVHFKGLETGKPKSIISSKASIAPIARD